MGFSFSFQLQEIIAFCALLFGSNQLLHRTLGQMADKYGKAFLIRLGIHQALVISSWEVAKECFTTNDMVFSTRPKSLAVKIMGYDHAIIGFAPYGPYWRHVRKLVTVELLSNHRLQLLKHIRDTEVKAFIKELYKQWVKNGGLAVEMKERFGDLAMNIIVRMIAGKRYFGSGTTAHDQESRQCQKALGDFLNLVGLFLASDNVPFLGWLDVVKGYTSKMKRTARELDTVLGSWVEEHRQKRVNRSINEEEQDFIHVMLSIMDDDESSIAEANTVIKATCLSLILGGNDTTVVTLTWALSLLLNNRDVLKKAQDEINVHVGKHRQVEESDIRNLIYLQAIVKETLRLYPALPLSAQREAMEDCTIAGFHIPAGTQLLVNLWKMHHDPSIRENP
ncbi:Cytochrome P450 protein [Melia azedarach]|uniref:Cytochrome P450 protein n=1 Tax=Melia azedarach TaxID=155640 RepID=A0ACC1XZ50_MELAZ|nr:Cytochrome P450 protein [Melia azedarach]